jgi:hypothetical protein
VLLDLRLSLNSPFGAADAGTVRLRRLRAWAEDTEEDKVPTPVHRAWTQFDRKRTSIDVWLRNFWYPHEIPLAGQQGRVMYEA